MKTILFPLLALVLGASALPVNAQTVQGIALRPNAERSANADAEAEAQADFDRTCLRQTATRIRLRDRRCAAASGRSWSRSDLLSTGQSDMGRALRMLDPSIY